MTGQKEKYTAKISFLKLHRADLDIQACQLHYPFYIKLESPDLGPAAARDLSIAVTDILGSEIGAPDFAFRVTADAVPNNHETALTVVLKADKKAASTSASLRSWTPVLDVYHNP